MALRYGYLLAMIALVVVLVQSLRSGATFDAAIISAAVWMALMGTVGTIVGAIATMTVDQSVLRELETQLAQMQDTAEPSAQPNRAAN